MFLNIHSVDVMKCPLEDCILLFLFLDSHSRVLVYYNIYQFKWNPGSFHYWLYFEMLYFSYRNILYALKMFFTVGFHGTLAWHSQHNTIHVFFPPTNSQMY